MATIISKEEFGSIRDELRREKKTVVLCHGVFDLLHPGHIQHLKEAKRMGDILVVSVTAEKYVRKGPGRPYFNDEMRLQTLAAISYIDYVMLSEGYTVDDIVESVQPDLYVKGQEYKKEEDDVTGNIGDEVALVRKYGGDVGYTNGVIFSSTKLINEAFPVFSDELKGFLDDFRERCTLNRILTLLESAKKKRILVVGDVIIDDYVFCKVQGLMSKNNAYSARYIKEEKYAGGSVAIARHLSAFCDDVTVLSVIGMDESAKEVVTNACTEKIKLNLIESEIFQTIIKKRYVEPDEKRRELSKVFVINNLPDKMEIDETARRRFHESLENNLDKYDAVFLCDFGHGLIDERAIEVIEEHAKKIVLNCQTNSSNYGLNLITKYHKADCFSLDEKELRLAFSDYKAEQTSLLRRLQKQLGGIGWLTRGSRGATVAGADDFYEIPAMVLDVVDTIGAGDAFFSLAGLMAVSGAGSEESAFMGNVAGALASNVVGNKQGLAPVDVLKFTDTLLKR